MKKVFFFLLASGVALSSYAQAPANEKIDSVWKPKHFSKDAILSRWVVDVNLLGGGVSQTYANNSTLANYYNSISSISNTGKLSFSNGIAYGFDAQLAFFFGRRNHFGLGAGFMYLAEQGDVKLEKYHVEYQSTDNNGVIFRQILSTNGAFKENLRVTNLNIPVLLKFKHRFSEKWGVTADAGALINLQMSNRYNSQGSFNYEAIYKPSGTGTNITASFDDAAVPDVNSILYTNEQYTRVNPEQNNFYYFNTTLRNAGLNTGLGVKPYNNTGTVSYVKGSLGFLFQPGVNYYLSDMVALNLGAYLLYQPFKNETKNNTKMLTDKVGDYSSVLYTAKEGTNMSYGLNLGVRVYLCKGKDSDNDGIPDRRDRCPDVFGSYRFNGCPDSDGDGIADVDDSCVRVPGIVKFNGCPDSDGDGIQDKDDACPYSPGPAKYRGCPDKDGDGILDKDDNCPDKPGLAIYHGCADSDGDGIPDNEDACPTVSGTPEFHGCPEPPKPPVVDDSRISQPILFEVDRSIVHKSSYPTLIEAAKRLNDVPGSYIVVDGYTDGTGSAAHNKVLSMNRAKAVKQRLVENMGIDPKRIRVVAHAEENPVAPNDTPEGRLKNRRAVMHLVLGE